MKKLLRFVERLSIVILVVVPVLAVFCIAVQWRGFLQDLIPFPLYIQFKNYFTVALFFCSCLFYFALIAFGLSIQNSTKKIFRSIVLAVGGLMSMPMFCIFGFLAISPEWLIGSATLDNHHYYVTITNEFGDMWVDHLIHKCNASDLECETIFTQSFGGSRVLSASFIVDSYEHEIHIFLDRNLQYTDGVFPREYKSIEFGLTDTSGFYLLTYAKNDHQQFVITKCNRNSLEEEIDCAILPFRYSVQTFDKAEFVTTNDSQEIQLLIDSRLIFSYDTAPHCHIEGCIITEQ